MKIRITALRWRQDHPLVVVEQGIRRLTASL